MQAKGIYFEGWETVKMSMPTSAVKAALADGCSWPRTYWQGLNKLSTQAGRGVD